MSLPNLSEFLRINELTQLLIKLESEVDKAKTELNSLAKNQNQLLSSTRERIYLEKLNVAKLSLFKSKVSEIWHLESDKKQELDNLIKPALKNYFESYDFVNFVNGLITKLNQEGKFVQVLASDDMARLVNYPADSSLPSGTLRLKTENSTYILELAVLEPKLTAILTRSVLNSVA